MEARRIRLFGLTSLALGLAVWITPATVSAQNVSVTALYRQYCCVGANAIPAFVFNSAPFAASAMGGGIGFGTGIVNVGPGPDYNLAFNAGQIGFTGAYSVMWYTTMAPYPPVSGWVSAQTDWDVANEAGSLFAGGQTGSAGYCPNYAGNPNCTDPAQGGALNGLVGFAAGPNQFGGTMRLLGSGPGFLYRAVAGAPSQRRRGLFLGPKTPIGGPFAEVGMDTQMAYFYSSPFPNPTPFNTTTMYQIYVALPWGTGMVYMYGTGGDPPLGTQRATDTGSDNRVSGTGNISLVSAGLFTGVNPFVSVQRLNLPEPGVTAAFASGIGLAVLLGLRRRKQG